MSLVTFNNVRYYTADDPFHYTVDNRPLQDLASNDVLLQQAIDSIATSLSGGNVSSKIFNAGTDFVAGTSTQLTLPSAPFSSTGIWIFFDGIMQNDNTYNISSAVVTFTSAIPSGVATVEVKWVNALLLNTPSDGTVTDVKVMQGSKLYNLISSIITPKSFGAAGNGNTNDDAAFTSLETVYKGVKVDLLGSSYRVTSIPVQNSYVNGKFIVSKTANVNGIPYVYDYIQPAIGTARGSSSLSLIRDARSNLSRSTFNLTQVAGHQSFAFDEVTGNIYTMHLSGSGSSEVSYISQYSMATALTTAPTGISNSSAQLGHQGLALEYLNNGAVKLWGSVRNSATYPNSGVQAIRFDYAGNAADLANVQTYTLFGTEFAYATNATIPTISYDQRFLCAVGRKDSRTFFVRVFDLKNLVDGGPGDYSNKWLYQWQIDSLILADDAGGAFTPVQDIACDGEIVIVLAGNSSTNGKRLHAYTIDGQRVGVEDNVSVGLTAAQGDGAGTFYEPECIQFYRPDFFSPPALSLMIVSGNGGAHINRIWALGNNTRVTSGTWTPTLTNTTNITASTPFACMYTIIGNIVTVSGRVSVQATAAGSTVLGMSLPFASNLTSLTQAAGTITTQTTGQTACGAILGDVTNDRLTLQINATVTSNTAYSFVAQYQIL